jgi:apolipoprotein N-acyltransferase
MPGALKQDINLNEEFTFYVKHGDYIAKFAVLGSFAFLIFLLISIFKKKA